LPPGPKRILDVACGAGSLLRQLALVFPGDHLYGVDLSPYYVDVARDRLRGVPNLTLAAENAESLPWRDGYFDALVSVYLFHEIPKDVRRTVLREMWRVLKPGGSLVIEDSAQYAEASEIASYLDAFSREMHEPYYRGYLQDDLAEALRETGFVVDEVSPCLFAKVVSAHKPG
jgi:ubiquinone/menaquinone biosynthesis C-methylase UbiE